VPAKVNLYDRLFKDAIPAAGDAFFSSLNPDSLTIADAWLEPSLADATDSVQFERLGYFCTDSSSSSDQRVFNRIVTLRDSWAKLEKQAMQQFAQTDATR
ncbi:MAG: hypothetical protein AAGJ86_12410, partial [Pseudomonadota bacterium]